MRPHEYLERDATALAALVRKGEVTPSELLEAAIVQIETHNPRVNAVIRRMFDEARGAIAEGLPDGPFRGVPMLIKDLLADYAGLPTTGSCRFLADHVPEQDSELVHRWKQGGLVMVGKTNTPELGIMGVTEPEMHGASRNPYHPDHTPGGSSGGSAAAVAARLVPVAGGGDGGGSIRIPASACGLVGLKPTRGRTPNGPLRGEIWSGYTCQHVLCRTVRDCAGLLDVGAGPEPGAPYHAPAPARPFVDEVGCDPGRLRIAYTTDTLLTGQTDPECRAAVEQTAKRLADLGHHVEEARPRFDRELMIDAYFSTVAANIYGDIAHAERKIGRRARPEDFELPTWILRELGRTIGAGRLMALHKAQADTTFALARFHERHDLLLTSTLSRPPTRIGELLPTRAERLGLKLLRRVPLRPLLRQLLVSGRRQLAAVPNTQLFNITGQPAISLPVHVSRAGLPVGVQLAAPSGAEATLLRVGAQLEAELRWDERRPPFLEQ